MKKIYLSAAVLMLAIAGTFAQEGTVFRSATMEEALSAAVREGKYVFVDCYTSWCGPCKNMTENIFPQKKMGHYFNPLFVSVKFDIEKEEDGKRLAKEFGIKSIPTFLVFKPDGTLLHTIVGGSMDADSFLKKVEESFDDEKAYGALKKIYESGGDNREVLVPVIESFTSVGDEKVQDAVAELLSLSSHAEKTGPDYWFIFSTPRLSPKGSANEVFLFGNFEEFRANIGRGEVDK